MQLDPVHAGSIVAGFGEIIAPELVALITENLVADRTGQHIELRLRDVFRRKGGVFIGWCRGVASEKGVVSLQTTLVGKKYLEPDAPQNTTFTVLVWSVTRL